MKIINEDFGIIIIGNNAKENWAIIDNASENDYWFHLSDYPSCHIICKPNKDKLEKEEIKKIGILCKINTNKCKNLNNIYVDYTLIKNVKKDDKIVGKVSISNHKTFKI